MRNTNSQTSYSRVFPGNRLFLERLAYSATAKAADAALAEQPELERAFLTEALGALDQSLAPDTKNGVTNIKTDNRIAFVVRALVLKMLGEDEQSDAQSRLFLNFSERERRLRVTNGHFFEGVTQALLQDRDKALASFSRISEESPGFYLSYWFDAFRISDEDLSVYGGIGSDILLKDIARKAREREQLVLDNIRQKYPKMMDASAGL